MTMGQDPLNILFERKEFLRSRVVFLHGKC